MAVSWKFKIMFAAIPLLGATPLQAAEKWSCEFQPYRAGGGTEQSTFSVEGSRLVEYSGDAIVDYRLLENSSVAIVAAKGGAYASGPSEMGFLVLIDKASGKFVLVTATTNDVVRQIGSCRIVRAGRPN